MAFAFNPLTGNFDLKGSGGGGGASYIDGEVATYTDLPLDGSAALNTAWLVREASGTWLIARKPAGIYIRTATAGVSRDADYTYAGILPDVFNDANFLLYDNADSSKNLAFQLSGIPTGTTRTVDAPAGNGRMLVEGQSIGSTTAAAGTFTTLSASTSLTLGTSGILSGGTNLIEQVNSTSGQTFRLYNTQSGTGGADFERLRFAWLSNVATIGTEKGGTGSARAIAFQTDGTTRWTIVSGGDLESAANGVKARSVNVGVFGAGDLAISSNTAAIRLGVIDDTNLQRDAAGVLSQRSATQAQEYRLFSTFTSSTNYQRMTIKSVRQTLSALSGASATTTGTFIPDGAVVVGVTTRVSTLLAGATGYTIGDGTDADRWGDITGTAVGTTSDNINWTAGTIECFTAGGNITLTAKGSNFTAGAIEISVFYLAGEAD
jgi:hypothetical protein